MTERKLSTLGYLMDRLGLSTAALARRLHVDASLVSKWRSGSRRLSAKSVYFDEVCRMLLEQNPMAGYGGQRVYQELADRREQKSCFTAC